MKLFERTGGYWMFWTGAIYLGIGLPVALYYKDIRPELIQLCWIIVLAMPFWCPPVGRWLNMNIEWDRKMFDFFRRKTAKEHLDEANNVYNLPKPKLVEPPKPEPKKEEPARIYYRLGLTDNNRVAFSMGYSEITMNKAGCQQMIDQLKFFQKQLHDDNEPTDDPDGGLPLPEENEQKAA